MTDPSLSAPATATEAGLLLTSAQQLDAAGHPDLALARLDELALVAPRSDSAAAAAKLRPAYEVAAAKVFVAEDRAADAVVLLDDATAAGGDAAGSASDLLPATLLAAGRAAIQAQSYSEAVTLLQRLTSDYPRTSDARTARRLLVAPQTVSGTLVLHGGRPVSGQVRLGRHFRTYGTGYTTSGPFVYATADANGDFSFSDVAVGGPYVLEVLRNGEWTTLIDPGSGDASPSAVVNVQPLQPVDMTFVVLPG